MAEGRKSLNRKFFFGLPQEIDTNFLPTENDIVCHTQYLKKEKINSGEWKHNTPVSEIARVVANDVCSVWDKTDIPHFGKLTPKYVREKIEKILNKAKGVLKIPLERRNNVDLEAEWSKLFDISLCSHREKILCECPSCVTPHPEICTCAVDTRVPDSWRNFLWDQRGKRQQCLSTIDRQKVKEERERLQQEEMILMRKTRDKQGMEKLRRASDMEMEAMDRTADDSNLVDSGGNRLSDFEDEPDSESDSEWEEVEDQNSNVGKNNTVELRRFSRECDRYKQSNRGAAKIANALLKDFGIVTETDQTLLVCPNKVKREREKWGQVLVEQHNATADPGNIINYVMFLFYFT